MNIRELHRRLGKILEGIDSDFHSGGSSRYSPEVIVSTRPGESLDISNVERDDDLTRIVISASEEASVVISTKEIEKAVKKEPERRWVYSDLGHHWLSDDSGSYHDFPCDHPEEHQGPEDN